MTNSNTEWWRGAVIYQVYPRSFQDSNGDGIGDLRGLAKRLPYIADLGIDAIWLSPFQRSPQKDYGYDVSDYCDVDPQFGTLDDFDHMMAEAHRLGLKVMIDQVWSHSSDQHPWFAQSRSSRNNDKADWYVWADPKPDGTPPNNWLSYFGGPAWQWDTRRHQYYLHHFLVEQPALNVRNPKVVEALFETAAFWLNRGVDGFRFDAVHTLMCDPSLRDNPARKVGDGPNADVPPANPMSMQLRISSNESPDIVPFLEQLRTFVDQWPGRVLLAETGGEDDVALAATYVQTGKRFHLSYTFRLLTPGFSVPIVSTIIRQAEEKLGDGWFCWSTSNHDVPRVVSRWRGNNMEAQPDFAKLTMAIGLSLRGSFCMYQGEELGLPEAEVPYELMQDPFGKAFYPEFKGRDGCRTPMPWEAGAAHLGFSTGPTTWLPTSPSHQSLAADAQEGDPNSVLNTYRRFLHWRKQQAALTRGTLTQLSLEAPLMGWQRDYGNERIICIFNVSDVAQPLPLPEGTLVTDVSRAEINENQLYLPAWGYAFLQA